MCPWVLVSFGVCAHNCGFLAQGLILTAMIVLACLLKADRYVITEHFREEERVNSTGLSTRFNITLSPRLRWHAHAPPTVRSLTVWYIICAKLDLCFRSCKLNLIGWLNTTSESSGALGFISLTGNKVLGWWNNFFCGWNYYWNWQRLSGKWHQIFKRYSGQSECLLLLPSKCTRKYQLKDIQKIVMKFQM